MGHTHTIREYPGQIAGIAALAAAVGAMTAMLFTPRTGNQARSGIRRRAKHGKDIMIDKMHHNNDEMSDRINEMQDKTTDAKEMTKVKIAELADKESDKTKE